MFVGRVACKSRAAVTVARRTKVTLPELDWDFDALEPHISGKINEVHYTKHHQTYVNGFNTATDKLQELQHELGKDGSNKLQVARDIVDVQRNLKFHGGGYANHCLFWKNLAPHGKGGGELDHSSQLANQINSQFGSLDKLISLTNGKLAGVQGSGWVFLVKNKDNGGVLELQTTANQDSITAPHLTPLLAIDAWEHAYYLQYQNRKQEYFKAIWNVINWNEVSRRFDM